MCTRPCVFADHSFEAVSAVKLLQYVEFERVWVFYTHRYCSYTLRMHNMWAGAPKTAIKIALHVFVKITHGFITTN